ncbi:glycosyltransferase family 2 protein [Flavobacterium sp.]|uniref:glycosyltransferase family 2 protein n=1 Tax=Flavobacterium sp. TaxID=239 RepID=UPI003D6A3E3B
MAFISVIIPLYNKENYIGHTIQSILDQELEDYEIIIVDDCSTDSSFSIASTYKSDTIRLVQHPQNKGLSAARNTGIRASQSNYVTFLDADDVWKPFFLTEISNLISTFPEAGIYGTNYEEVYQSGLKLTIRKNAVQLTNNQTAIIPDFYSANIQQPIYCFSSVAFKKEVFDTVGYFDEIINFGEDIDFNIRVNFNYLLAYSNRICASYTVFSENQITNSTISGKIITDFDKYEHYKETRPEVKKYLDFKRYTMAVLYKMAGEKAKYSSLKSKIAVGDLTLKQRILLQSPLFLIKKIKQLKQFLLQKGIKITSYD